VTVDDHTQRLLAAVDAAHARVTALTTELRQARQDLKAATKALTQRKPEDGQPSLFSAPKPPAGPPGSEPDDRIHAGQGPDCPNCDGVGKVEVLGEVVACRPCGGWGRTRQYGVPPNPAAAPVPAPAPPLPDGDTCPNCDGFGKVRTAGKESPYATCKQCDGWGWTKQYGVPPDPDGQPEEQPKPKRKRKPKAEPATAPEEGADA
jgi:hypothetical protein